MPRRTSTKLWATNGPLTVGLLIVFGAAICSADDRADESYTFQFVGEDGKPVSNCFFMLVDDTKWPTFEQERVLYREKSLGPEATITIKTLPVSFWMQVKKPSEYYDSTWRRWQLMLPPGKHVLKMEKTGIAEFEFEVDRPQEFWVQEGPVVLAAYRKSFAGDYVSWGGIGLLGVDGVPRQITGLAPGEYKFELRKEYTGDRVYWSQDKVLVKGGETTSLRNLKVKCPPPAAPDKPGP